MQKVILTLLMSSSFLCATSQTLGKEVVEISTPHGVMTFRLYKETPLHRKNFLRLVRNGFYDSLLFHRVINQFMIQGGDPLSRKAKPGDSLGHGESGKPVPAEFRDSIFHRKGVIAAARESDNINPERASSACQFYIVMGKPRTPEDLKKYEARINKTNLAQERLLFMKTARGKMLADSMRRLSSRGSTDLAVQIDSTIAREVAAKHKTFRFGDRQVKTYTTVGGTPHLDGSYTVFGEIVEGMEVIDRIAAVRTDSRDRPLEDVRMRMRVLSKKEAKERKKGR
jgi:peptidylprolyl isomerase